MYLKHLTLRLSRVSKSPNLHFTEKKKTREIAKHYFIRFFVHCELGKFVTEFYKNFANLIFSNAKQKCK